MMTRILRCLGASTALFAALLGTHAASAQDAPLRIGVITFLSGPAAGPFGVPAKNAADLMVETLNKGGQIPGYEKKGFGGRPLEVVYVDEAGGPTKVVTEYRNLVARQDVDMVIGVISSGDCLAVAPVAEELKKFTILFDCATNRIFEERFNAAPVYASYHLATAFFGVKAAYEKAQATNKTQNPSEDQLIAALEHLKFESVAGTVDMALGKGHQAVQHVPYGTVKKVDGKLTLINIKYYPPSQISPPDGMKSVDWIRSGFKR